LGVNDAHCDGVEVVRAKADTDVTALLLRPDSFVAWASSEARPTRRHFARPFRQWFGGYCAVRY